MSVNGQWQLKSLILRYCKVGGSSRGVRDFLSDGLIEWAKKHPHVKIRVQQLANRHPVVYGEYADGTVKDIDVKNESPAEIEATLEHLRSISTAVVRDLSKPVVSSHPSVQGPWDPSTTFEGFSLRIGDVQGQAELK